MNSRAACTMAEPGTGVDQLLAEHFRCPEHLAGAIRNDSPDESRPEGFFQFGGATCYGRRSLGTVQEEVTGPLQEALPHETADGSAVRLPFDPVQVIENLRHERYLRHDPGAPHSKSALRAVYYLLRPLMPVPVRRHIQKARLRGWDQLPFPKWPVDRTADAVLERLLVLAMKARGVERLPFVWFWPKGAGSCAVVTHDVETAVGTNFCPQLMDLNDRFGIKSSFQIVPEKRYTVKPELLEEIQRRGFEVNVHDLNHDGHLFRDREEFLRRAERINEYGRKFGARGFRSAVLYRNADWLDALDFSYDMSIPNVAHLDPQRGGCCTVFPFFIGNILELPVTMVQDYSLFHILGDYSTRQWEEQISRIRGHHGLMNVIVHPDYITNQKARDVYAGLLQHLSGLRERREAWIALPGDVAEWWRQRRESRLVRGAGGWKIEGPGRDRATVAYAVRCGDALEYEFDPPST